jgi:hypothetical protein
MDHKVPSTSSPCQSVVTPVEVDVVVEGLVAVCKPLARRKNIYICLKTHTKEGIEAESSTRTIQ